MSINIEQKAVNAYMTKKEKIKEIKEQVSKVIHCSQDVAESEHLLTDELVDKWFENKSRFMKVLNADNNYIYESSTEIEIPLSEESKRSKFFSFLWTVYPFTDLNDFLNKQGVDSLFDNSVKEDYQYTDSIMIPKGMKLLKAMKFFVEDPKKLEDIQNLASQIIQENKMKGKLCISIHPLDYLSISENQHNWRSCHALDGEYRAGNLSYMMDSSTIVAYIKSKENTILPHFPQSIPWNNKKWRVLIYLSENGHLMFAGKQYPFTLDLILKSVRDVMIETELLPSKANSPFCTPLDLEYSEWCSDYVTTTERFGEKIHIDGKYLTDGNTIFKLTDLIEDNRCTCHYNDVLRSTCYDNPKYAFSYRQEYNSEKRPWCFEKIKVGHQTYCLKCGKYMPEDDSFFALIV